MELVRKEALIYVGWVPSLSKSSKDEQQGKKEHDYYSDQFEDKDHFISPL